MIVLSVVLVVFLLIIIVPADFLLFRLSNLRYDYKGLALATKLIFSLLTNETRRGYELLPNEKRLTDIQSTPNNSNLQGKLKKDRVIGSREQTSGNKEKNGV